jgi:hypothetical protein
MSIYHAFTANTIGKSTIKNVFNFAMLIFFLYLVLLIF